MLRLEYDDTDRRNGTYLAGRYVPDERTRKWNYYRNRSNPYNHHFGRPYDRTSQSGQGRYPDSDGASRAETESRPNTYPHSDGYDDTYSGNQF